MGQQTDFCVFEKAVPLDQQTLDSTNIASLTDTQQCPYNTVAGNQSKMQIPVLMYLMIGRREHSVRTFFL